MPRKKSTRYTEEFKKTIVNLHQNGKSYAEIEQEYGVSHSALAKWIKQYSVVKLDDDTLISLSSFVYHIQIRISAYSS